MYYIKFSSIVNTVLNNFMIHKIKIVFSQFHHNLLLYSYSVKKNIRASRLQGGINVR